MSTSVRRDATQTTAAPTPDGPSFTVCFHGIGTPTEEREPGEAAYWVTDRQLRSLLDWLVEVPRMAVSFDDGNGSDVDVALPALTERGMVASFFPVVGRLGDPRSLSARSLEELTAAGMDIGSHGMTHVPWSGLRGSQARDEIVRPRHVLEDLLGRRIDRAAAPLGRYDRRALGLLRTSGFAEVSVSDQRPGRPGAWLQPRFSVRADDTVASLRARMHASLGPRRRVRDSMVSAAKRWA